MKIDGTGSRLNCGKPEMSLVPLRCIVRTATPHVDAHPGVLAALQALAAWQERTNPRGVVEAAQYLGPDGWPECARVLEFGARKYAPWNWARGLSWSSVLSSATRHLLAMLMGESIDSESGLPHRGHALCNLVFLMTYESTYPAGDDRAPAGTIAGKSNGNEV